MRSGLYCKQPPGKPVALIVWIRGSRYKERTEVRAAERAIRDVAGWHLKDEIDCSVWSDSYDAASVPAAVPDEAAGIDAGAVGQTSWKVREMISGFSNGPRLYVIVVRPDFVDQRVSKVEVFLIWTPNECVRDANLSLGFGDRAISVETVQNSVSAACLTFGAVRIHVVAHGTRPKRSPWINSSIVQPYSRPIGKLETVIFSDVSVRLPKDQARPETNCEHIVLLGKEHRSHRFVEEPGLYRLRFRIKAVDEKSVYIGPVDGGFARVPKDSFSASVPCGGTTDGITVHNRHGASLSTAQKRAYPVPSCRLVRIEAVEMELLALTAGQPQSSVP